MCSCCSIKISQALSGLVGGGIFGKILQRLGVSAGTAAAGEAAAAAGGVTATRMALGTVGSALMLRGSTDPNAAKNYSEVTLPKPFENAVANITNPKRPMFFDENGQLICTVHQDVEGNRKLIDNGLSNWEIIMEKLSTSIDNFANKFNQTPMMMTPSGLPMQTKQTLNVTFNLDGKQIATKMVDITDKNQEDILLSSSYPEEE